MSGLANNHINHSITALGEKKKEKKKKKKKKKKKSTKTPDSQSNL